MLIREFGSPVKVACDLSHVTMEDALLRLPIASDYLLRVSAEYVVEATDIKKAFEGKMAEAHAPIRIHVILDDRCAGTGDRYEWQLFSLLGSIWSPGA